MSELVPDLSAIDADIHQLEVQIAQLEHNKIQLKRRRNAAIPISRIPSELLIKIFSFSLTRYSSSDLAELPQEIEVNPASADDLAHARVVHAKRRAISEGLRRPQILSLCHVSHDWRELAFDCRELWNHIQVQLRTAPELLELMWRNAGQGPIQLDLSCGPMDVFRREDDLPALSLLKALVKKDLRRLKSVGIYCCAATMIEVMDGCADDLEVLVVVESAVGRQFAPSPKFLEGGAPNLHRIELTGVAVPWTSPIFKSIPHLTHLKHKLCPTPTPESIAQLAVALKQAQALKVLELDVPYGERWFEMEHFLSSTSNRATIDLADLEVLNLRCKHHGPMGALLQLLHVPRDIKQLVLVCEDQGLGSVERILNFARCGRGPEEFIAPEDIEFGYGYSACWRKRRSRQNFTGWWIVGAVDDSLREAYKRSSVWHKFVVGSHGEAVRVKFTAHPGPPPWSFANLREISITCDGPADFWRRLASASTLEVVRVSGIGQRDFIAALGERTGATDSGTSPKSASSPPEMVTPGMIEPAGQSSLFPSLQAVEFPGYYWHIAQVAGMRSADDANRTFLHEVAGALSRWGGSLKEMKFEYCRLLVPESESLDELSSGTSRLVWDGQVYLPKSNE